jgi:hypothetical protein
MFTEADNLAITRTELDSVFFQTFETSGAGAWGVASAENGKLFRQVSTTHSAYIHNVNMGSGKWSAIGETEIVPSDTPKTGYKNTVLVSDYGQKILISKNLFDDNMHDVWAEDVRNFALMARVTQDDNAFGIFRGAFTTTLCPDTVALISASHVTLNGDTVSNLISGALSTSTLNSAMVALREQKNQRGVILGSTGKYLLVPPKLWKTAVEITDSVLVSDSANNAVNVYRSQFGIEVMTSQYLGAANGGSDTAWFLLSEFHGIKRVIRQGVQTSLVSWEYSDNRSYKYQGNFRETYFAADWAGIVGATGV